MFGTITEADSFANIKLLISNVLIKKIKQLLNNKFIKNTSWIFISQIFYLGVSFFVSAYAARLLGPSNLGIMDLSNNYISIMLIIASLGIDAIIVNDIVNKKDIGEVLGTSFVMKIASSIVLMILLNIYFYCFQNRLTFWICFIQSFTLIFRLYSVYDLYYQSKLESKHVVLSRCITSVIFAIIRIITLVYTESLILYCTATTLEYLGCLLLITIKFRKTKIKMSFSLEESRSLLSRGYHFILSDLLVMIYTRIDKLMLEAYKGVRILGIYSIAALISELWVLLPNAIITSARPKILEYKNINYDEYIRKIKQLYAVVFYLGIAVSIFMTLFSKYIILLLYGNQYLTATTPISILSFATIFATLGSARSIWIIGEGLQKHTKKYIAIGALVNIILNSILIKPLGMTGVAVATLVSQVVVSLIAPIFIKETRVSSKLMIEAIILKGIKK